MQRFFLRTFENIAWPWGITAVTMNDMHGISPRLAMQFSLIDLIQYDFPGGTIKKLPSVIFF